VIDVTAHHGDWSAHTGKLYNAAQYLTWEVYFLAGSKEDAQSFQVNENDWKKGHPKIPNKYPGDRDISGFTNLGHITFTPVPPRTPHCRTP
jgi:hypothetical protein